MMCKRLSVLTFFVVVLGLLGSASAVLNYEYYEAPEGTQYRALADVQFGVATPVRTGTSDTLNSGNGNWVEQAGGHRADDFGFRFFGYIVVPVSGEVTFYLRSDDGSQLFIDGQLVVDNDGLHGTEAFPGDPGTITLQAGVYSFEATQFERGGGDSIHVAWSAGGQAPRRVPDSVLFTEPPADISQIPVDVIVTQKAFNPSPPDGAVDLEDADVALLTWTPGYGAVSFNVYIDVEPAIDEGDFVGTVEVSEFSIADPLVPGLTYYWRVDSVDADGNVFVGDVWSATARPIEAHFPSPIDGAEWQPTDVQLEWSAGLDALVHDVFFSTDRALVEARDVSVKIGFFLNLPTLDPGPLEENTTYYWAVDEFLGVSTNEGSIWSFTTLNPAIERNVTSWQEVTASTEPAFQLTHVANGVYDIGDQSGDITYEFIVLSNPDETAASMALIGEMFNNRAGLKYEQWNNTGTYGATLFGVVDLDFGVPTAPGEHTHLTFVSSEAQGTTTLFVNGEEAASVDRSITLNGIVGLGRAIRDPAGEAFVDDFDGNLIGVALYDKALTSAQIRRHANAFFNVGAIDITKPGDAIQGVPNDGDWPGGEHPGLAIDDDFGTKYLHFKGETQSTGFQVAPSLGATVISGLTLTSANDAVERDPIAFEIYGSNESIDGPYELIAAGDVVDFAQADAWPRFTTNETQIKFENSGAYLYYQVLFPAVRNAGSANSMQIAEVEILGTPLEDVTGPDDAVQGVPNDGDWPGGEHPALAVDDNVNTKFLHFKGETQATGIQITPAVGGTVVQGLRLTTANDAVERDPIAFEIYGSNEGIDGPYELIAAGDVVDFAQADAWPRFTANATAIVFGNAKVYTHYQVLFPTVRNAAGANSMQIAEVELLGVALKEVTGPEDAVQGVPNDGDWPGGEHPALAVDNDVNTKFLHFKGETQSTGFQITPSVGGTVVRGLSLTTANDAPERDPISFEVYGTNEGIDGSYTLIAAGDVVDFAQEAAWPRFTPNATPIVFDNATAYDHYQILFPTVRNAASANSMQIAEVELLGLFTE